MNDLAARYIVVEGSVSGHCCFEWTVADLSKPTLINGEHYSPKGVPQYWNICECFDEEDAAAIASALNKSVAVPACSLCGGTSVTDSGPCPDCPAAPKVE